MGGQVGQLGFFFFFFFLRNKHTHTQGREKWVEIKEYQ